MDETEQESVTSAEVSEIAEDVTPQPESDAGGRPWLPSPPQIHRYKDVQGICGGQVHDHGDGAGSRVGFRYHRWNPDLRAGRGDPFYHRKRQGWTTPELRLLDGFPACPRLMRYDSFVYEGGAR